MRLITLRDTIKSVPDSFAKQYHRTCDSSKIQKLVQLKNLDTEIATVEDITLIIGNNSWTKLTCDECGEHVQAVVMVGQEPDYESATVCLCKSCASKVINLFA